MGLYTVDQAVHLQQLLSLPASVLIVHGPGSLHYHQLQAQTATEHSVLAALRASVAGPQLPGFALQQGDLVTGSV